MSYYLKATSCKNFIVEKGHQQLYQIDTNWSGTKAYAAIGTDMLEIKPTNFWKSKFNINYSGKDIGTLHFNWRSHGFLDLVNEQGDILRLTLKQRGFFSQRYEVYTEDPYPIITLFSKMDWFKFNYDVQIHDPNFNTFPLSVLMGILGFVVNTIRRRNSGN